jgi:hypothetical protein
MGRIKPKTVSDLMDVANRFADGEDRQRMIEETDMEVKGEDPTIMTTTALTAK